MTLARPLALGALAAIVSPIPYVPGCVVPGCTIASNLVFLGKHRFSKIVTHVGANDICSCQSKVSKSNIVEVCKSAKVIFYAAMYLCPIPKWHDDDVVYHYGC